jgi:hypothetical protein
MEDEILPHDMINEIMKWAAKITLVDFICTCRWIRDIILPVDGESKFITRIRTEYWSDDIRRACKGGDHLSLIRLNVETAKLRRSEREWFTQKYREGLRIACMRGNLGMVKNLYRRIHHTAYNSEFILAKIHKDTLKVACCKGYTHIVRWLFELIPACDHESYMKLTFRDQGMVIRGLFHRRSPIETHIPVYDLLRDQKYTEVLTLIKSLT